MFGCDFDMPKFFYNFLYDIFHSNCLLGDLLVKYSAVIIISGYNSSDNNTLIRIIGVFTIIIPPDYSTAPFCSGVYI